MDIRTGFVLKRNREVSVQRAYNAAAEGTRIMKIYTYSKKLRYNYSTYEILYNMSDWLLRNGLSKAED